ncbi:flagellar hook-associated protein FlgK [Rheinheimera sp.]|uniref:flagellar hook-associated protein FlgK n=1 Tax=Rheinheimera sp. TaxID=1869214 RepID=UPI0027BA3EFA|nr:flagellar hook-associated protein FlgK [Rheinheimera sp.]
MSDNLLTIGTSGVLASNGLLNTTSNNISNLNTKGYVRQSTEYESSILGLGVGRGTTSRMVNEFALKQLRRDTTNVAFYEQYLAEAGRVDTLFANTANSVGTGMTDLFKQLQTANNDPANNSSRSLVLGSAQTLINKFNTQSNLLRDQQAYINEQLSVYVSDANSMVTSIAQLNKEIAGYGLSINTPPPLDLLDKRDEAIRKLAELADIQVLDADNGEKLVFLSTGQSVVLEQGKFNLLSADGDPEISRKIVKMQLDFNTNVTAEIDSNKLGGKIGGLLEFRSQILEPTLNKIGQLALGLGDSFNVQNKLGMDGNGLLGKDLFTLGVYSGMPYRQNTGLGQVLATVEPGEGKNIPPNDFLIEFVAPNQFTMSALDERGAVIAGSAVTQVTGTVAYGFEINMDTSTGAFAAGDKFLFKPLSVAANEIALATTRPEDLALASPVRGDFTLNNLGNARFGTIEVTDTTAPPFAVSGTLTGGPFTVRYLGADDFEIFDGSNTSLGTTGAMPSGLYNNVMAAAGLGTYGFDFNITGVPKPGDTFTIDYNTSGFKDNRNGLALSALQTKDLIRKNAVSSAAADNSSSFTEAYGDVVSFVGQKTSQIRIASESAKSVLAQSEAWYESVSGVNLDEEAANLIRFQQSYAAAAKIIATSQTIFDTLLQAAR